MSTLFLLRHSLTEASERRLYCGWADPPLSPAGRALAEEARASLALPDFRVLVSSGLRRADGTLWILTGQRAGFVLPDLREYGFGEFEMRGYDALKDNADYQRWITDESGDVPCPGGESRNAFKARVLRGGRALLALDASPGLAVLHGGVIAALMSAWFPGENRGFYDWQPAPCRGYCVQTEAGAPIAFAEC